MRSKLANDKRYWLKLLNTDVSKQRLLDYHTNNGNDKLMQNSVDNCVRK
jgi:hypothetical protein